MNEPSIILHTYIVQAVNSYKCCRPAHYIHPCRQAVTIVMA